MLAEEAITDDGAQTFTAGDYGTLESSLAFETRSQCRTSPLEPGRADIYKLFSHTLPVWRCSVVLNNALSAVAVWVSSTGQD